MNGTIFNNPLKKGYLLVPRVLLLEFINKRSSQIRSDEEAFMTMLCLAYHTDYKKGNYVVKRGESDLNIQQWADIFGWSTWKVRCFLGDLQKEGQISYTQYGKIRVISLLNYELFCGNQTRNEQSPEEKPMNKTERMFMEFWESYHELTLLEPSDLQAAKRMWKLLTYQEKQMAITNIYEYVMRVELKRNLKKAYRYLFDKEFR